MPTIKFDRQQQAVISAKENNICVIAGAGSGKTSCLTARVRRLLNEGVDPHTIVCITFTKAAAQEMKSRLADLNVKGMFIGTIHSYAYSILARNHIYKDILSDNEANEIAEGIVKELEDTLPFTLDEFKQYANYLDMFKRGLVNKYKFKDMFNSDQISAYNAIVDTGDQLADYDINKLNEEAGRFIEAIHETSAKYGKSVRTEANKRNKITFNELLHIVTNTFEGKELSHLLVDEFQDVGLFEYNFIMSLPARNKFLIGDDFQSIYKFKGARFEFFQNLIKNNSWKTYMLTNNYRSCSKIVKESNEIISCCTEVIPKECKSKMTYTVNRKPIHESGDRNVIYRYLQQIHCSDWGKWFVITRSNNLAITLNKWCYCNNIDSEIFKLGGKSKEEIDQIISSNKIKVMTIHSAKGLECDNVILAMTCPTPAELPDWYSSEDCASTFHTMEDCRLYYTGVTRARKNLIVVHMPPYEA